MKLIDTIFGLVVFILSIIGAVTIFYYLMEWVFADKLYDITEQEFRDSKGSTWIVYTKHYKFLGIKFTKKVGPFKNYNNELKCKIENLRIEQEEAKLKASLKPVIKL